MIRCGEVARESNAAANLRRIGTVVVCSSSCWLLIRSSLGDQSPSARVHPLGDTVASLGLQGTDQRLVRVGRACIAGQAALHHAVGRSSYRQASVGLAACAGFTSPSRCWYVATLQRGVGSTFLSECTNC